VVEKKMGMPNLFVNRWNARIALGGLLAVACLTPPGLFAQGLDACGPTPLVKAALDQIPSRQSPTQTDWQFHEQQLAAIQALRKQYPDDLFIERFYISRMGSLRHPEHKDQIIQEFKARHEQAPNGPKWAYLYGEALVGRDSPGAIKLLNGALAQAPSFPWPRLALVEIYNSRNFRDKDLATTQIKAFLAACPESLEGYRALAALDNKELILPEAAKLRTLLQGRSDAEALRAYPTLWSCLAYKK
jgi:hypothetical protein